MAVPLCRPTWTHNSPRGSPRAWAARMRPATAKAARQACSACSGLAAGAPQKAMTASPMNLSTVFAFGLDGLGGELDDGHPPVAQTFAQAGEAGEVGEQDGQLPLLQDRQKMHGHQSPDRRSE